MKLGRLIESKGLKMRCRYGAKESAEFPNTDPWTCTLRYGRRQMTVPFYMGYGHHGAEPDAEGVMDCLLSDASAYDQARHFEDFALDFGYNPDSRRAERIFKQCGRISKNLRRLLGDDFEAFTYAER